MDDNKSEFVREKIKSKPVNKKRMAEKFLIALGCGLIAAVAFCLVVALALPAILKKRGIDLTAVTEETEVTEADTTAAVIVETQLPEEETQEDTEAEEETETELLTTTDTVTAEPITPEEYQSMMKSVYAIGDNARLSTVTVTSITASTDWFNRDVESKGTGLGVILQRMDTKLLVLTDADLIANAKTIQVSMEGGSELTAELIGEDAGTGLAMLSVSDENLTYLEDSETEEMPTVSAVATAEGDMVIAIQSSGMYAGLVTSTDRQTSTCDHNYSLISTDITAASNEPGILVNLTGEMIGVILPRFQTGDELSAIPITQLKAVIDLLKEARQIPYLGLSVSTVTDSIADQYGVPKGVYVTDVAMDSPAMLAGIQAGDVVTAINGNEVRTDGIYSTRLLECNIGDEIEITLMRLGGVEYSDITYEVTVGKQ